MEQKSKQKTTQKQKIQLDDKTKLFILIFSIFALAAIIVGIVYACVGYSKKAYSNPYTLTGKVGYYAETLGTVERQHPEISNEGLNARYPVYGKSLSNITAEEKAALIQESSLINGTSFDQMDSQGYLYKNGVKIDDGKGGYRKLYKHTAADSEHKMYYGEVSDSESAIIKRITCTARGGSGYHVTGVYAPAGEVIKIEISEADLKAAGNNIIVYIGQALYNGQANNIWAARNDFCRMPVILTEMHITSSTATLNNGVYTCYVGSFLGGPIYIKNPAAAGSTFSATITGGINYAHFILGYTSKDEFNELLKSSAPYFDLEVWDRGVLHSGPRKYYGGFNYDELYNAAILFEKISLVSTRFGSPSSNRVGIVFIYEPFVAAGAAVAFPGRNSVNCPCGWFANSLNYKAFVQSGSWGNVHEYNHHFQNWGRNSDGEVTNNAVSLVEYSLFTKISEKRTQGNTGETGLSGWNRYTSASWAIDQIVADKRENPLSDYASILHSFGQENFIQTARSQTSKNFTAYYNALTNVTHYNFTYFFNTLLKAGIDEETTAAAEQKNYPAFVPVASIYQTGRSISYDGKISYTNTVQPYVIEYNQPFNFNFERYNTRAVDAEKNPLHYTTNALGGLVLPDGFSYKVKSISQPEHGKIKQTGENTYTYTPVKSQTYSGKIYVTLQITKDDGAFNVDDVTLVLEFKQKISKPNKIEKTTYSYSADKMYNSVEAAVKANYAGYTSITNDFVNYPSSGLNGNAQVWYPAENTVTVLDGKLFITESGKYRFGLRATYANLYISLDGGNEYKLAANVKNRIGNFTTEPTESGLKYYSDYNLEKDDVVYFKIVVINNASINDKQSYADLGMGLWSVPDGGVLEGEDIENGVTSEPTVTVRTVTTAYVRDYVPDTSTYKTDYFFTKTYTTSLTINDYADAQKEVTVISNSPTNSTFGIDKAFNNNYNNGVLSKSNTVSKQNPFEIVADIGEEITANTLTIHGASSGGDHTPTAFTLYGGTEEGKLKKIGEYSNLTPASSSISVNKKVTVTFSQTTFRYFKLVVTDAASHTHVAISAIKFSDAFSGTQIAPDNSMLNYAGKWQTKAAYCNFGHIYAGKNATVSFKFHGTRFAIYSVKSPDYKNFEVIIDDAKAHTVELKSDSQSAAQTVYISNELKDGEHEVVIRSKSAFNIDSVAITFTENKPTKLDAGTIILIVISSMLMAAVIAITVFALCPQALEGVKGVFKGGKAKSSKNTTKQTKKETGSKDAAKTANTTATKASTKAEKTEPVKNTTKSTASKTAPSSAKQSAPKTSAGQKTTSAKQSAANKTSAKTPASTASKTKTKK